MVEFDLKVNIDCLLTRLLEVRQRREEYQDGSPRVLYCLKCDESVLRVREDGEYKDLDCQFEHSQYIIEDSHENSELTGWINCLQCIGASAD